MAKATLIKNVAIFAQLNSIVPHSVNKASFRLNGNRQMRFHFLNQCRCFFIIVYHHILPSILHFSGITFRMIHVQSQWSSNGQVPLMAFQKSKIGRVYWTLDRSDCYDFFCDLSVSLVVSLHCTFDCPFNEFFTWEEAFIW